MPKPKPKKIDLTNTGKNSIVFARVPRELASALDAYSEKYGASKNWLVNQAIQDYLRKLHAFKIREV